MLTFWLNNNINWASTCKFGTYNIFIINCLNNCVKLHNGIPVKSCI